MFAVNWVGSNRPEVALLPGDVDKHVGREPVSIAVVVRKVGDALDHIEAPLETKERALDALLTEYQDRLAVNEPTFSKHLDPTPPRSRHSGQRRKRIEATRAKERQKRSEGRGKKGTENSSDLKDDGESEVIAAREVGWSKPTAQQAAVVVDAIDAAEAG